MSQQQNPLESLTPPAVAAIPMAAELLGQTMSDAGTTLPDGRACMQRLKTEVYSKFGPALISVLQPFLRELAFNLRRDCLSEPEKTAISGLAQVQSALQKMGAGDDGMLKPVGGSADIFLRDVFAVLLEQVNEQYGNPLIIRSTVCPDYPTDGNGHYLSRGGLGTQPGLSAEKIVEAVRPLLAEMSARGVPTVLELCYADIECLDAILLKKSGVERGEFQRRVDESGKQAQERFQAELSGAGMAVAVRAGSMIKLLGEADEQGVQARVSAAGIGRDLIGGIASHRRSFYSRFFANEARGFDVGEFYDARAAKDVDEHVRLGNAVAAERAQGEKVTLVTMSIPALARYLRHHNDGVAVLAIRQDY